MHKARILLLALALLGTLSIFNWHVSVLILSFACAYLYFGRKLTNTFINSHASLLIVTLFTHTATLGIVILICSALLNISLASVLIIDLILFALLLLYEVYVTRQEFSERRLVRRSDVISILVACLAFCALSVLPLANLSAQKQHGNILIFLTGNTDSAAHLAMFNDYLGFGTTQIWNEHSLSRGRADGFYPSSWHGANATIAQAVVPSLHPGAASAALFGLINVSWISVLVFMVSRYAFTVYELNTIKNRRASVYIVIPSLSLLAFYLFFVHLLRFGFFSFTPQLIATILLTYCLHQVLQDGLGVKSGLGLAILYCAISMASWVLLLPVAAGATILTAWKACSDKHLDRKIVLSEIKSSWSLFALGLMGVLAQLWIMHNAPPTATTGVRTGLLLDGGAPVYSTFIYVLLFAALGSAILYAGRTKRKHAKFYMPALISCMVTIIFAGLLFVYQVYYTSTTHYYYYKCVWLLPTLLSPMGIAMIAIFVDSIKDRWMAVMAALTIPILLIQFIPSDTGVLAFMRGSRTVSTPLNQSVWTEMHHDAYPTNRVTIYFVDSGTNESSTIATLLVAANRPFDACLQKLSDKIVYKSIDTALREIVSRRLAGVCNNKQVNLEVDPAYKHIIDTGTHSKEYRIDFLHV